MASHSRVGAGKGRDGVTAIGSHIGSLIRSEPRRKCAELVVQESPR